MSKFDLRDISERLAGSKDTEAVVFEFLGYLQGMRPDWHAALAFYEVSRDRLEHVYERRDRRLIRRDIAVAVDQLPARLVRKFFHPSAFFNAHAQRRSLLSALFHASPAYEPDASEIALLRPILPAVNWQSCVCFALADREDVIALLVLGSDKRAAFNGRAIADVIPIKSIAALAITQHLQRASVAATQDRTSRVAASEFQDRIRRLSAQAEELEADNRAKAERLVSLSDEIEKLDRSSTGYREELQRVKQQLYALEEQTVGAAEQLSVAFSELGEAQSQLKDHEQTLSFLKNVFQLIAVDHDPDELPATALEWFCEHFTIDRCSLMLLDTSGESLRIIAHRGISDEIVPGVRVRVGQGVAGWVAHNRKPLLVRSSEDEGPRTGLESYNSDSFVSVPLVHGDRLIGVLNLSNKRDGEAFDELDLDRAMLTGSVIAIAMGTREQVRRAAAWS